MRETRQSGSEGGGDGVSSYPYRPIALQQPLNDNCACHRL